MKLLHTADWHLGHRLHEHSQQEEQQLFLEWLTKQIDVLDVDVLLISGDVYDTGVPSTQSQKMYYDFLINLQKTNCSHVVITGGNHDAPGTINAPKALLQALSIHVVGKATEDIADEVFELSVGEEHVIIAAVPYLRDQDIRRAVAGESFDQITDRYKTALVTHYSEAANYCNTLQKEHTPIIAMGHLFAIGGSTSDSEQNIYVGTLGHIGAEDFPETFDYIALGHLHRPQIVGGYDHIRYSGSPNILSFSEIGYDKKMIVLETQKDTIKQTKEVTIPTFRKVLRVKGTIEECITKLQEIDTSADTLTTWVEVVLDTTTGIHVDNSEIKKAIEDLNLEVLKVTVKNERTIKGLEQLIDYSQSVKELSPVEVFKKKCEEQEVDLAEHPELLDAFQEIVQIVREQ
ncbi:exonuclease SbcCD subunit D C-terminal domain-containing protein [Aquimarina sp. RZ0]|uniref:exonuclease SbcCD subunit D C-terminal domain-containing protein n=1 Tax=Aquimarina sp. RZ0 TaxID=2607730 RepID=UPI0011F34529|nr:exonuclease SbcCD subunit D C-terminal domain-containing protein [Aquimarina sp. RZ0]KAA1246002.1 exonuclease subunit SbcD [Aquimarina sp. RZ0]